MGKKKSKTAKQKQVKAASSTPNKKKKSNSQLGGGKFGGVRVVKGGKNGKGTRDRIVHQGETAKKSWKKQPGKEKSGDAKEDAMETDCRATEAPNKQVRKRKDNISKGWTKSGDILKTKQPSTDTKEFKEDYMSLVERNHNREIRQNGSKQKKKKGPQLSPAIFAITPKTPQQVLDEAALQISAMSDLGQKKPLTFGAPSPAILHAEQERVTEWEKSLENHKELQNNNPFAAFEDEEDDDSQRINATQIAPPSFMFAPATFQLQGPGGDDDFDPDL